jgi:hypothetical protein
MPPEEDPLYRYSYLPTHPRPEPPLLASEILTHMFYHPKGSVFSGSIYDRECRNRLPKRIAPLIFIPRQGHQVGWGIEFIEGVNWTLLLYSEAFIAFVTVVFCLLWALVGGGGDRVSTAFTIGQWMLGVGNGLFLVFGALSEFMSFWRY